MTPAYTVRITGAHTILVTWPGCDCEPEYRNDDITAATYARKVRAEIAEHLANPGATLGNYQW